MKYILSWNSEVLQMQLLAGPLAEEDVEEQLKKIVIKNLSKLSEYSETGAERRYLRTLRAEDEEDDELVVYETGASIRYGTDYEEYYHVVDYEDPLTAACFDRYREENNRVRTGYYIAMSVSESYIWFGFGTTEQKAKEALIDQWNEFFEDHTTAEEFEEEYEIIFAVWINNNGFLMDK